MRRFFSNSQKLAILKRSGYQCQICGTQLTADNFSADHIIPYSKGGKTQLWNGQALCRSCNSRKGDRIKNAD